MKKQSVINALVLTLALGGVGMASAQDRLKTQDKDQLKTQDKDLLKTQDRDQLRDQDRLYADELMTDQERTTLRERLRLAKTEQERARIREEHRLQMDARAKERGVTIKSVTGSSQAGTQSSSGSSQSGSQGGSGSSQTGTQSGSGSSKAGILVIPFCVMPERNRSAYHSSPYSSASRRRACPRRMVW